MPRLNRRIFSNHEEDEEMHQQRRNEFDRRIALGVRTGGAWAVKGVVGFSYTAYRSRAVKRVPSILRGALRRRWEDRQPAYYRFVQRIAGGGGTSAQG